LDNAAASLADFVITHAMNALRAQSGAAAPVCSFAAVTEHLIIGVGLPSFVTLDSKVIDLSIMTHESHMMNKIIRTDEPSATKRSTTRRPNSDTATPTQATEEREPRGARRKRETRARLLEAALKLVAAKGVECVAISEITESADVGFGSFYNHFESKEAIYAALVDWVFEEFADTLDRLASGLSDPAEVIAVCVRHTLMRARREPVWGQFLIREGFSARALDNGLSQRLLRDSETGVAARRFVVADPFMSHISVSGTVLAAIAAELSFAASVAPETERHKALGLEEETFAERAAVVVLQALGLKRAEAEKITQRPLPAVGAKVKAG
jgi:AcrR family transcriptional regulator